MSPVRKPKPPVSAWIVEQRNRLGWKSEELARRLGVADPTVRGWEAGRSPGGSNLVALERLFGVEAPGRGQTATGDLGDVAAALLQVVQAQQETNKLLSGRLDALEELVRALVAPLGDEADREHALEWAQSERASRRSRRQAAHRARPAGE